ncbi:putative porin [Flavobacterium sp. TSSA_36]|uniref:putative porin n=1 Tax=Flavobacterium sp. TSSA_36 TaxID=3447669 RepID=UPI003F3BFB51
MKNKLLILILLFPFCLFSQKQGRTRSQNESKTPIDTTKNKIAPIDLYRIITLEKDTTYIDTSLSIRKEYTHNYLRKDNFGLLSFSNDGQTFNTLQYGLVKNDIFPEMGFKAKHFNFMEANQIRYASVATPVTELYFKTTIQQGQSLDSYFAVNIKENLNFSVAYRGLRSLGNYINQLSSSGNFRFTSSYYTLNRRYLANFHFTYQDILNGENSGITTVSDFESEDPNYDNRARLEVFLTDAKSFLKGRRIFLDHSFRINTTKGNHNLWLNHQFNYENKFFEYNQATLASSVGNTSVLRFGEAYVDGNINDQTHYNKMYNRVGVAYENEAIGKFNFFMDDFRSNFYYYQILVLNSGVIPGTLSQNINTFGGQYLYNKGKWNGDFSYSRSITNQSLSNLEAKMTFDWDEDNQFAVEFQNKNKIANNNFNLYQSSFINYNWFNNFKNEKNSTLIVKADTQWVHLAAQYTVLKDYLYFDEVTSTNQKLVGQQIIAPKQYDKAINYFSLKVSREFKFGKFALDNTFLYQKVDQPDRILNLPELTFRNAIYFSDSYFKNKALFLQTGFVLNYFTSYYANDYNPVVGEFFVQDVKKIGNFPMLDFFINAKIQRTRIYLKAEHFNSVFAKNNYFSAPNTPYRDFTIRFGLIWNFFN